MKISEVCTRTGLTDRAIRFYIEKGLLKKSAENINGRNCREYDEEDVRQLNRISALRKAGFSIQDILKMQQAPQMVQDVIDAHSKKLEAEAEAYLSISGKLKSIHVGGVISWQKLADVMMADGENVWSNAVLQWPEEMPQMEGGQLMETREQKDNNVEKRSLMYSQIFNYNVNRDGTRTIDISAAVAGGGKSITNKKNLVIGLCVIVIVVGLIFGWSFAHDDMAEYINNFVLEENDVEILLPEPQPVKMDVEAFTEGAMKNPSYVKDVEPYYYKIYDQWKLAPVSGGNAEPVADDASLRFGTYKIYVYPESKIGKVQMVITDADAEATEKTQYTLYGTFKIADYTEEDVMLAKKEGLADFAYGPEDGNRAYFIRDWEKETYMVYFEADNILYEMQIPATNRAVKNAKQIFDAVAGAW